MDIQSKLNKVEISPGMPLSVKIGLGVGECRVLFVGGQFKRCEYLIVGEGMRQACESETKCTQGGQTICSDTVYDYVKNFYEFDLVKEDDSHGGHGGHGESSSDRKFYHITKVIERVQIKADSYLMRTNFCSERLKVKLPLLKTFVPAAITLYLDIEKESFSKEIRMITTMFLNLKVDLSQSKTESGIQRIQDIVHCVQRNVYRTKGSLNKFLMDDKGSVMLICWGLPPLSASDDHTRCVLSALDLVKELKKFNCGAYMGITTGSSFAGVCGASGGRREYSLLGDVINLAARHMQKAIEYAAKNKKNGKQMDHVILICEKTRELIQNKIPTDFLFQDTVKGLSSTFFFYEPNLNIKPSVESSTFFLPSIKTHKNNIMLGVPNPNETNTPDIMLKNALFMVGRKEHVEDIINILFNVYKHNEREFILIRGITGSGKSLLVRKVMYEFIEMNKDLKNKINTKNQFIFISHQMPTTLCDPMNGWSSILRDIFNIIKSSLNLKIKKTKLNFGGEQLLIDCDAIGEILVNSDCMSYVRYIEEILDVSLTKHYEMPDDPLFIKFFSIKQIPPRDPYFETRKFERSDKSICRFFSLLIKKYKEICIPDLPLILILEDCHLIDEISVEFIRILTSKSSDITINGICVLSTYMDSINTITRNPLDNLCRANDLIYHEKTFILEGITEYQQVHEILKHNLKNESGIERISEDLINIVLTKSFKGNPLFTIEILISMIEKGFAINLNRSLVPSEELLEIYDLNDWSKFSIPIRMEKLLGNIIDNIHPREILLLKYASVIGNLFDIDKLYHLNPFNSITFDDLTGILINFEKNGIIEILYDLNPKQMVCQFSLPFLREILFQRMLIEQRNDIHINIARKMQYSKFSYMPIEQEDAILKNHLKTTEKTILAHMKDKVDVTLHNKRPSIENYTEINADAGSSLNINNMKMILVKDICERLKVIDLRLESENTKQNKSIPVIKCGYLYKKADKYISWEQRFVAVTNTKLIYWYKEIEYVENKMPLGSFDLKYLYSVEILPDKERGDKNNLFHIQVSSWYKKDEVRGSRNFYFSCATRDDLYEWVITLNFLRVKAIYDEFSYNYGMINLPLMHELKNKNNKRVKEKFSVRKTGLMNRPIRNLSNSIYAALARKSNSIKISDINYERSLQRDMSGKQTSLILRRYSVNYQSQIEMTSEENDNTEKLSRVKDLVSFCFNNGLVCLIGFIQNIIYDIENVGMSDEKTIAIPNHLVRLRNITLTSKQSAKKNTYDNAINKNSITETYIQEKENEEEDSEYEETEKRQKYSTEAENKIAHNNNGGNIISSNYNANPYMLNQSITNSNLLKSNQIEHYNKRNGDPYSSKQEMNSKLKYNSDVKAKKRKKNNSINLNLNNGQKSLNFQEKSLNSKLRNLNSSQSDEHIEDFINSFSRIITKEKDSDELKNENAKMNRNYRDHNPNPETFISNLNSLMFSGENR